MEWVCGIQSAHLSGELDVRLADLQGGVDGVKVRRREAGGEVLHTLPGGLVQAVKPAGHADRLSRLHRQQGLRPTILEG